MIRSTYAILGYIVSLTIMFWYSDNIIEDLHNRVTVLESENNELKNKIELFEYNVIVTMYNPTHAQTDRTPNELADGTKINPRKASLYRFVALSRDLLKRWGGPFDYGDYIVIEGIGNNSGVYQVRDTMNSRFTKRVDILKSKGSNKFKYTNARMYSYTAVNENNLLAVD